MSNIPKAKCSKITDLSISPDGWDSYPEVEWSEIHACTFRDLSSKTQISRSTLTEVTVEAKQKGSHIERSELYKSSVVDSYVERSKLDGCTVSGAGLVGRCTMNSCSLTSPRMVERVKARSTNFFGSKRVERSEFEDSAVLGNSSLERCVIKSSVIADSSQCERSEMDGVMMTRSRMERSKLKDCDVMDCSITRTDFEGMILKNGIWKNGDLIGRMKADQEVVIKPRSVANISSSAGVSRTLEEPKGETAPLATHNPLLTDSSDDLSSESDGVGSVDGDEFMFLGQADSKSHSNNFAIRPTDESDPPPAYRE